jgi:hypothetical protein
MALLPSGNKYTPRTTPLHVYQLVLEIIRETFRGLSDDHIYKLTEDIETTGVLVDTTYNKDSEAFGRKPLIVVSRGGASTTPAFLGDTAVTDIRLGSAMKTSIVHSSVIVKVISDNLGQVDILANEIFNLLLTCRTVLPQHTSIQTITNISMSDITPFTQGVNQRLCTIMLSYSMQYRWTSIPPQLLLQGINQKLYTGLSESENPRDTRDIVS